MATTLLKQLATGQAIHIRAKYSTSIAEIVPLNTLGDRAEPDVLMAILVDSIQSNLRAVEVKKQALRIIRDTVAKDKRSSRSVRDRIAQGIERANTAIFDQAYTAEKKEEKLGASVIVALFQVDSEGITVELLHEGNCRAYLIRAGKAYPLTTDHSWRQEQIARGVSMAQDDSASPESYQAIRYLGASAQIRPDENIEFPVVGTGLATRRQSFHLEPEDRILLCSVGLTRASVERALPAIWHTSSKSAARSLVKQSTNLPATDATALVITRPLPSAFPWPLLTALLSVFLILGVLFFWRESITQPIIALFSPRPVLPGPTIIVPTPTFTPIITNATEPTSIAARGGISTAVNSATLTPTASATNSPTATPPVAAALATLIPTATPTWTPIPSATPIPPSATAALRPTDVAISTTVAVLTLTPTITRTVLATSTTPISVTPDFQPESPTLLATNLSVPVDRKITFEWRWNGVLDSNWGFEVRIWQGSGYHSGAHDAKESVKDVLCSNNLCRISIGIPLNAGNYKWAVAVVQLEPYLRIGQESLPGTLNISGQSNSNCQPSKIKNCPNP